MRRPLISMTVLLTAGLATVMIATELSIVPVTELRSLTLRTAHPRVVASDQTPLTHTYQNYWNVHDQVTLDAVPELLISAILTAEDRRFFDHGGVDWIARWHALVQNAIAMRNVRGASTLTEQTVRMVNPRARTLWSRWLEGVEATRLEKHVAKNDILEFYLNQVPYAANRRGVVQAARYYFDRSIDTLSPKETLALAVLVRAPSRFDLWNHPGRAMNRIRLLAERMVARGEMPESYLESFATDVTAHTSSTLSHESRHFARYVLADFPERNTGVIHTTLDTGLQAFVQRTLDRQLAMLAVRRVENAAALLVDLRDNTILAWTVGGARDRSAPGAEIDTILTPRQPGSTLKPFVYALAMERGWSAATLIDDTPLAEGVGAGLHRYQNYSRTHYGAVTVRDALGNSLNIPAVKALQFVGIEPFLQRAKALGIRNLQRHPVAYGDGLALGNGEISLFELVQAYSVIARRGKFRALSTHDVNTTADEQPVFSSAIASLISDMLSDPNARVLEFGTDSVLNFVHQTAVKTGTSSNHTDAWAVGYNHRYLLGVWMGNLDRTPTDGVTGSTGPAYVLRSVFSRLNVKTKPERLYLSRQLIRQSVCVPVPARATCRPRDEWFRPGQSVDISTPRDVEHLFVRYPSPGMQMAMDPRIPDDLERFRFELNRTGFEKVVWIIDEERQSGIEESLLWKASPGVHRVSAEVWRSGTITPLKTASIEFTVR